MKKLRKFTITFGIITLVSFLLTCVAALLLNLLSEPFKGSPTTYLNFLLTGSFSSNSDILSYIALGVLGLFILLALVWLVLLLIKKKWMVFLYFVLALATGLLFSYTLFLFSEVTISNEKYFYFKEAVSLAESGALLALLLSIILLFFVSITVCFVITFEVLSIVYAYKEKKDTVKKVSKEKKDDLKPVIEEEVKEDKIVKEETSKPNKEERILLVKPRNDKVVVKESAEPSKEEKVEPKKEEKVSVTKEVKADVKKTDAKKSGKVYHVSHHPSEDKWQVKLAKGEKALKLFDTQLEAIQYAKEVSKSQGGSIRLHSVNGRIRKI